MAAAIDDFGLGANKLESRFLLPRDNAKTVISRRILHFQLDDQPMNGAIRASPVELEGAHCFVLKYDCVRDQYRRPFNVGGQTLVDGWHRLAHSARGVSRLTEREQEEFAYIGSNGANGEVVWRVHHPGARVARLEVLLSGMSTPDPLDGKEAKIGVDLQCGEHGSQRRPDAIPFNAQRIDVMEMEQLGRADFTEVRVCFQRAEAGGKPSQLFRAVFGEAATADDFVIRIEFEQPLHGESPEESLDALAADVHKKMLLLKAEKSNGSDQTLVQLLLLLGRIPPAKRQQLAHLVRSQYGDDLGKELEGMLPRESAELVTHLLKPHEPAQQDSLMPPPVYPTLEEQQNAPIPQQMETVDVEKAAEILHKSIVRGGGGLMKMFKKKEKSDTEQMLGVLLPVEQHMRQMIANAYKRRFEHEELADAVRKEVQEGHEKELLLALVEAPASQDAHHLHKAIAGLGTTESVLTQVLATRSNAQLVDIKKAYGQLFGTTLEADVNGDTSGTFRSVLLAMCAACRDETPVVRQEKAEQDAQALYAGGEKRWGTDEDTFVALLTCQSLLQVRALNEEYARLRGHPLDEAIRAEFSGDARDVLTAIVRFATNPGRLFAEWIGAAIRAGKESDAIRLICSPPDANFRMAAVADEYQTLFGYSLRQALLDSRLHTKQALADIVARGGIN